MKISIPSKESSIMKRFTSLSFIVLIFFAGISCNTAYQSQSLQYNKYTVTDKQPKDSAILSFLQPYSNNVNQKMNEVVGVVDVSMDKDHPESALGNFMVDAFFTMAKEKYTEKVDGAILNYGGIRLTQLPAGNITNGKVFELMPFDNLLILQKMKGTVLQQVLDLAAYGGGWPIAGITMQIKDKKAINIKIGGKPFDPEATYNIANSDFLANGGDNLSMLKTIPQITNGYLMREVLFDYIKKLKAEDKNISATIEKRVTNAE